MDIDLDEIIKSLKKRFEDLRNYFPVDPNSKVLLQKRAEKDRVMADINEEIIEFARIRADTKGSKVIITPVSEAERTELEDALRDLDVAIRSDEVFHRAIAIATAALEAGGKLRNSISAPTPAAAGLRSARSAAPPAAKAPAKRRPTRRPAPRKAKSTKKTPQKKTRRTTRE